MGPTELDREGVEQSRSIGHTDSGIAGADDTTSNIRNKRGVLHFALAGAVLTLVAALVWWLHERNYTSTDDAFIDAQVVRIAPQVSGIINELNVSPNVRVKAGEQLLVIAPDTVMPQIARQQADVSDAQARAASARAEVRSAEAALQRTNAAVALAMAQFANAQSNLARLTSSHNLNRDSVAVSDMDNARTALDSAKARLVSAQGDKRAADAQLLGARQAVNSADAGIRSAQAQAQGAQVSLDHTRIIAPMNGSIANLSVNRGSYVAPGMQLMALVPDDLWVTANFKETQLKDIHVGDPVEIKIDAFPDRVFAGKVASIQRASGQEFQLLPAQNATGNFVKVVQRVPVRIVFTEKLPPELSIGPGMSVVPTIRIR